MPLTQEERDRFPVGSSVVVVAILEAPSETYTEHIGEIGKVTYLEITYIRVEFPNGHHHLMLPTEIRPIVDGLIQFVSGDKIAFTDVGYSREGIFKEYITDGFSYKCYCDACQRSGHAGQIAYGFYSAISDLRLADMDIPTDTPPTTSGAAIPVTEEQIKMPEVKEVKETIKTTKKNLFVMRVKRTRKGVEVYAKSRKLEELFASLSAEYGTRRAIGFENEGLRAYVINSDTFSGSVPTNAYFFSDAVAGVMTSGYINLSWLRVKGLKNGITMKIDRPVSRKMLDDFQNAVKTFVSRVNSEYIKEVKTELKIVSWE